MLPPKQIVIHRPMDEAESENEQEDLAAGFTVIRFSDQEILQDINRVIWAIEDKVEELRNHSLPPPPAEDSANLHVTT